jgi:two-component system, cell cycle sensor histidine kinase and response regulator CckA
MNDSGLWKVLIIEDDRIDREIYKRRLLHAAPFQFEFVESDSAAAGIEMANRWAPDCILLDFSLPDMDGLEALPRLRGENNRLPCAVVMLTAFGGEELAAHAMKSGAMDYLPKGQLTAEILPHTVVRAIERFQMQASIDKQSSALARDTRQSQTLLEAIPQMVWTANAEGRVQYANRQWLEYTGLSIQQAGRLGWEHLIHPEDVKPTWCAWDHARQTGSVFEVEHRLKRAADNSYRWHLVRAVPFHDGAGHIANWVGTCTEIESRKQAETVNLQREKVQSIGQLAAGIAHDFNNLLVAIVGGASYVMETLPPTHPAQKMLQGVVEAGERAAELTGKMLVYAGKGNLHVEPTDLNQLVRDACDSLRASIPKSIRLHIPAGRELPPVATDSRQMRQVIVDLVMNAVEAIREGAAGTISVRTRTAEVGPGSTSVATAGRYVVLEVRDTGCGINEETQKRIFDPFYTTKFLGRGLGLAAVQGFVRSNGGDIQVDSTPGKGACFRIFLPAMHHEAESRRVAC